MNWDNLEHMAKDLGLKSNPEDIESLKAEIRTRLPKTHSDLSGGHPRSEKAEQETVRLTDALNYCRAQENMLVRLNTETSLVKELAKSLARVRQEPVDERITKASEKRKAIVSQKFRLPKISLGVLTGILGFIFMFPNQMVQHPYLHIFVQSQFVQELWMTAVMILSGLWFLTWRLETKEKNQISHLFSLDFHRWVLKELIGTNTKQFSRTELRGMLAKITHERHQAFHPHPISTLHMLLNPRLGITVMDEATDLALERYLERNWVRRIKSHEIDDWYEIIV